MSHPTLSNDGREWFASCSPPASAHICLASLCLRSCILSHWLAWFMSYLTSISTVLQRLQPSALPTVQSFLFVYDRSFVSLHHTDRRFEPRPWLRICSFMNSWTVTHVTCRVTKFAFHDTSNNSNTLRLIYPISVEKALSAICWYSLQFDMRCCTTCSCKCRTGHIYTFHSLHHQVMQPLSSPCISWSCAHITALYDLRDWPI